MNYQKLVDKGLLRKEKIGFDQIDKGLKRAAQKIKSAKILIKNNDEEGGFQFAYDAVLSAGRALAFSFGFRPRALGSHKIVVDFSKKVLGKGIATIVFKFNKMRKIRHYLIYGSGLSISEVDTKNAISSATKFLKEVKNFIKNKFN